MIVDYIDSQRERFGVEPVCAVLAEAGISIAPSTYYARSKPPLTLLSSSGVTIEEIAYLVGHGCTSVTERVYRKELRPVITRGVRAINELFDGDAKR